MNNITIVLVGLFLILVSGISAAGPDRFEKKGFISNDTGEKCWYQQRILDESTHFHGTMTSTIGEIVFDDAKCMSDSGRGMDINKLLINNVISKWYSHSDANFNTGKLYKTSMMQKIGQCIQSKTYPIIGITVDYIFSGGSIVKVLHGPSLQGCTKANVIIPRDTGHRVKDHTAPLTCDRFEIVARINGSTLEVSLETDLPDDTNIMISVDRSYWERGSSVEYARPYFDQKSTVGEWRRPHEIDIRAAGWRQNLRDFQAEMARATLGFEVARISDNIEVKFVVPFRGQTNSAFGDRNRNLQGKAVTIESFGHLVQGESQLNYPL